MMVASMVVLLVLAFGVAWWAGDDGPWFGCSGMGWAVSAAMWLVIILAIEAQKAGAAGLLGVVR